LSLKTFHIHIKGIVQGVGFRPFVYQYALKNNLKGWVNNTNDGVHIQISVKKEIAIRFLDELLNNLPPLAQVTNYNIAEIDFIAYSSFDIVHSNRTT